MLTKDALKNAVKTIKFWNITTDSSLESVYVSSQYKCQHHVSGCEQQML